MTEHTGPKSDLVHISKLNGDFRRNYGPLLGAYLYLRSIDATSQRRVRWLGILSVLGSALAAVLARSGAAW
ncbi:hypothetical protein [Bradyrhizobium sp. SZCCHNS2017]|uniref:hypothetical protein n=1 Tax=Bradyrhizobium sp. SZCCHNS2017 TaxID=3057306 RepID=UPI0029161C76|nr:hypothetical protein [Bradyrhizobium sp. SZCCHNS2017]